MVCVVKTAILLLTVVYLSSGAMLRSKEHAENLNNALKYLEIMGPTLDTEIRNFTATGYRSKLFDYWVKTLSLNVEASQLELEDYPPELAILVCLTCRTFAPPLIADIRNGRTQEEVENAATSICESLLPFDPHVCRGLVRLNVESFMYILINRPVLTAVEVCALIFQGECGAIPQMFNDFPVNVSPGPAITAPKTVSVARAPDELRILHLSDIHHDENYLAGGIANCPNPVCCRRFDGIEPNPNLQAGPWGDYNCNSPYQTIEDMLRRIRAQHPQIDVIYQTGDLIDHGIWETSAEGNRRTMGRVFDLLRTIFPGVPVYSTIGNHEAHPTNLFAPSTVSRPSFSTSWLYEFLGNLWQSYGWIPADAANSVRSRGYYTVLVRPGFRLVVLNNNDCYIYNWWMMYSRVEIQSSLQWVHNTLLLAEQNNERVHILAHIPSGGGSCVQFWSRQYRRIIDRFHNIIGAQFNGHSHRDEFEVYYDVPTGSHAINVAWNGGSATAYTNVNPNYRLYYVDRTHYQVNEAETYIFSISEAQRNPSVPPRWYRHYSFSQAFGITNYSPNNLDQLIFTISRNRNLNRQLYAYKVKSGDPRMAEGCDDDCLRSQVCTLATNEHDDLRRCNQVLSVFATVA